ncbi:hypothetical protein [Winogradskyella arenosi]|uniref:Aspartyl protease n=1 Tax=Winogradskyella arenosi TaxID=533325 RepID=A0A368ZBH8_9FLAO|nr:hypothetical protein [Winogradskyella arenosi]RCW89722.1 hypothetical protein DFQ08_1143 [Winogradskyella arenosi]
MNIKSKIGLMFIQVLRILVFLVCVFAFGQQRQNTLAFDNTYNVNIQVNDTLLRLQFDTGSATSIFNNEILNIINRDSLQLVSSQDFTDPFGNITNIDTFRGLGFSFLNLVEKQPTFIFNPFNYNQFLDCEINLNNGILGLNIFFESKELLSINHDNSEIGIVTQDDIELLNYTEIGADFRDNSIYIDTEIGGKYVELLFDTGYNDYILLNKRYRKLKKYKEVKNLTTMSASLFSISDSKEIILEGVEVELANIELKNNIITINPQNTVPVFGSEMIKKFNWIIDFKSEKVFLQKRKDDLSLSLNEKLKNKNVALAITGKLYIISSFQKEFKSGQVIMSVQDKIVTSENICAMQKLLNDNSSNWTALKIK